jgi:hypothetical protein
MGKKLVQETQKGILERVSNVVRKVRGDNMSVQGWKAIAIVGVWASVAVMTAVTGEMSTQVVSSAVLAILVIAMFL